MMEFSRELGARIQKAAVTFPIVVVTGARQVGKTTLLRRLFPDHNYVSLDLPSVAEQAESSPELFLSKHPGPLLLDEVQYAPALFRHLKVVVDTDRHKHGQYVLTGSQKFALMRGVADSLAGRCAVIELEGLSLNELASNDVLPASPTSLVAAIGRGNFPELWRQPELERNTFYRSYISTYLERDVRQILNVGNLRDFERFVRACAIRSGGLLNKTDLARDVGITAVTANEWLSIMEASNQITLLEPWFGNFSKRLTKAPKLFVNDTGLMCYLLSIAPDDWPTHSLAGAIFETFVFGELRRALAASDETASLWLYRDASRREVDFLVEQNKRVTLLECKARENLVAADGAAAKSVAALLRSAPTLRNAEQRIGIVGLQTHRFRIDETLEAIPATELATWLGS